MSVRRPSIPLANIFEAEVGGVLGASMFRSSFARGHLGDPSVCHTMSVTEPEESVLNEQGGHARDPGTSDNLRVLDTVTLLDI